MRTLTRAVALAGAAIAWISISSCVELTGQRITIDHDAAADRLTLFLAYDGIHDDPGNNPAGAKQIPEFAAAGDVMFVDWWGRVSTAAVREAVGAEKTPPALRELARATLRDVTVETLGHYASPRGRIGAVQRVQVRSVSTYLRTLNAAIDESVLEAADGGDGYLDVGHRMPLTRRRMEDAARGGHEWLRLENGALHLRVPMNRREYAATRVDLVCELFEDALSDEVRDREEALRENVWLVQEVLGQLSVAHSAGITTFTLGNPDAADTVRVPLRQKYEPSLEPVVREHAPRDLDAIVARSLLLGEEPADTPALADYLWVAPPEDRVRAVLAAARGKDGELRGAADRWLEEFAVRWNAGEGLPSAPTEPAEREQRLAAWAEWYAATVVFPLEE